VLHRIPNQHVFVQQQQQQQQQQQKALFTGRTTQREACGVMRKSTSGEDE
jgi:hypothetical protein